MSGITIYSYLIDDNYYSRFYFSENISVKGFLEELEHKLGDGKEYGTRMLKDIHCVYLKGNKLDEHTLLKNYLRDLTNIPLIITRDPTKLIENTLPPINIDDYTNLQFYKRINDGYLIKAIDKKTGKTILIRSFNDLCENLDYVYAYKVASTLNHDGIAKILGFRYPLSDQEKTKSKLLKTKIINKDKKVEVDLTKFIIIHEFVENGDIEESVKNYLESKGKNNEKMNPTIRSKIIYGVASTMKYAHEKGIIHDDLKLENIFLDKNLEPKISGFRNEKFYDIIYDDPTMAMPTPYKLAPEKLMDEGYSLPSDVYSFAFLLFKMFSNLIEFTGKQIRSPQHFFMNISRGKRPKRPENIQDSYWDLIQRCWKQDPADRPTFQTIINELKDDKYAINEFGMKTNLGELHKYQKRIDSCGTSSNSKTDSNDLENQNKQLKTELDKLKRILFPSENKIDKNTKIN